MAENVEVWEISSDSIETQSLDGTDTSTDRINPRVKSFTACIVCRNAHTACDPGRPCKRCVKLNKVELCKTPAPKKRGPKRWWDQPETEPQAKRARIMSSESRFPNPNTTTTDSQNLPSLTSTSTTKQESDTREKIEESEKSENQSEVNLSSDNPSALKEHISFLQDQISQIQQENHYYRTSAITYPQNLFLSPHSQSEDKILMIIQSPGIILSANLAMCQFLGYTPTELKSLQNIIHLLPPEEAPLASTFLLRTLLSGQTYSEIPFAKFKHKTGRIVTQHISQHLIFHDNMAPYIMIQGLEPFNVKERNVDKINRTCKLWSAWKQFVEHGDKLNGVTTDYQFHFQQLEHTLRALGVDNTNKSEIEKLVSRHTSSCSAPSEDTQSNGIAVDLTDGNSTDEES